MNEVYCWPQVEEVAIQLQSMLHSLVPGQHMGAMGKVYFKFGLQLTDRRLESCPVDLSNINIKLPAAKARSNFPRRLAKFFEEPDSRKYFDISKAGAVISVSLRIGDLVADHMGVPRPPASSGRDLPSQIAPRPALKGSQASCSAGNDTGNTSTTEVILQLVERK